jgi:Cu/Ag efflux pump CusA
MRVWVNPDKLANLGVTVSDITSAVKAQNKVNPAGQVGGEPVPAGQQFTYNVRAPGRLPTKEEFGEIVVRAQPDGSILRLKDVARVDLGSQYYSYLARLGVEVVRWLAQRYPKKLTVEWEIEEQGRQMSASLPSQPLLSHSTSRPVATHCRHEPPCSK